MSLKEIISLHCQKNVYVVEDEEGVFLYRFSKTNKYSIQLRCRRELCKKIVKLRPIYNVR